MAGSQCNPGPDENSAAQPRTLLRPGGQRNWTSVPIGTSRSGSSVMTPRRSQSADRRPACFWRCNNAD